MPNQDLSASAQARRERFRRVAARRTTAALQSIVSLAKCSNKSAYLYNSADVERIFSTIQSQLDEAKTLFERAPRKEATSFSFEDE